MQAVMKRSVVVSLESLKDLVVLDGNLSQSLEVEWRSLYRYFSKGWRIQNILLYFGGHGEQVFRSVGIMKQREGIEGRNGRNDVQIDVVNERLERLE